MKVTRVGIAQLKAHLSEYIARARDGEHIVVCDRERPVAELRPLEVDLQIRQPAAPWSSLADFELGPARADIDVVALLREDRDQR